jgi:drug/metabolite transporter (DMT)-like permease
MAAASIWGGMYVVSKVVLAVLDPIFLVWLRYFVAMIVLAGIGLVTRQSWGVRPKDGLLILAIGVIGYFFSIWAQFAGTQLSSAHMGAVITSATPALMIVFARVLLNECFTLRKALSLLLATFGVFLIIGIDGLSANSQLGGLILFMAAVSWALMSVLVKLVPERYSQLVVTIYAMGVAFIVITPLAAPQITLNNLHLICSQPWLWLSILYLGVVSTAGAFYFWNMGLQLVDASQAGIYFFFQPLVGTLLGWFFLGEQVGLPFGIGSLLIILGVLLVLRD